MPVHTIQINGSRNNGWDVRKAVAARNRWVAGEARQMDSYRLADTSNGKFIGTPLPRLARARTAKPRRSSYHAVCRNLASYKSVVRSAYKQLLAKKGAPVVSALVRALKHKSAIVRSGAADVLGRIFQGAGALQTWKGILCKLVVVPGLHALLKDRNAGVRKAANDAVHKINSKTTATLPETDHSNPFEL